jgi:hypothetical protein
MRSIANVIFVIVFIIIIYSQITNIGISNYGIKKMLPRLIIAAVLVNASYIICAVAVDASNIIGNSLNGVFLDIRNHLVGASGNSWQLINWSSISSAVLAGGTMAGAGIVLGAITLSTYGAGVIYLLLPVLMTGLMAILVALLIMAARQALIVVLVILSPLAFIAYLLPNTETWFKKWKETFMTMLMIFPIFSVIFGGSQLAGIAIIQNADNINSVILGMFVQIAPLFITPLLIKFSGSMLSNIAGIINNPNKGLIDRTKNWSNARAEESKARMLGTKPKKGIFGAAQRNGQRIDQKRRRREYKKKINEMGADARWTNSGDFKNLDQQMRESTNTKTLGENVSGQRYLSSAGRSGTTAHDLEVQLRNIKLKTDNANLELDNQELDRQMIQSGSGITLDEQKLRMNVLNERNNMLKAAQGAQYAVQTTKEYQDTSEYTGLSDSMKSLVQNGQLNAQQLAIQSMRTQSAKRVQGHNLAKALENSAAQREVAGADVIDKYGAQRSLASSVSTINKAHVDSISNIDAISRYYNLSDDDELNLALGKSYSKNGVTLIDADEDSVESAIRYVASNGNIHNVLGLVESMDLSKSGNSHHRVALVEGLRKNGMKPKFYGAGWMNNVTQGLDSWSGESDVDELIKNTIHDKKISAETIVTQDRDALERVLQCVAKHHGDPSYFGDDAINYLKSQIEEVNKNTQYTGRIAERRDTIDKIQKEIS